MQEKYIWAAVVGVVVTVALGWNATHTVDQGPAPLPAPQTSQAQPGGASIAKTKPARLAAPGADEAPLAEQVEQLAATHDPENEYKAYWLIRDCEAFNRVHDNLIMDIDQLTKNNQWFPFRGMTDSEKQHETKVCTGMTERMRTSRFNYLADAVKAGVSGAVVQVVDEGPFGDRSALTTRPDDPLVQEWTATVKEQLSKQAESGDLVTLNYLWAHRLMGDALIPKDPALAYRYAVALGLIFKEVDGPQGIGATMYAPDGNLAQSIPDLSAEQRAAELAAARHIADAARERRHH
jgi:hypothetical protein